MKTPTPAVPAAPPQLTSTYHWQDDGLCRGMDGTLFFGVPDRYGVDRHRPEDLEQAKDACAACPVREECLDAALDGGADVFGIWGGTTKADREKLTRRIRRVKCPICTSTVLRTYQALQVCGCCGHSWPTKKPGQAREGTGRAA